MEYNLEYVFVNLCGLWVSSTKYLWKGESNMKKNSRAISLFMVLLLLSTVLLSHGVLIHSAQHDCVGTECEVCLQMEQAKQIITGLKLLFTTCLFLLVFGVITPLYAVFKTSFCVKDTLILLKVELLD